MKKIRLNESRYCQIEHCFHWEIILHIGLTIYPIVHYVYKWQCITNVSQGGEGEMKQEKQIEIFKIEIA